MLCLKALALIHNTMDMELNSYSELWNEVKKYISLKADYAKLTAVEKLTILLSAITFVGILIVLSACALFFMSAALVEWLDTILACKWLANIIVCGIVLLLIIIACCFKKVLILNPVARFVTKLFLNPPTK